MNRKHFIMVVITGLAILLSSLAFADRDKCCMGDMKCPMKSMMKGGDDESLKDKFMKKVHFILDNQAELQLTDDQIKSIKSIKYETKKAIIRQDADEELVELDIKQQLSEDTINIEAINQLIDQKHEISKMLDKKLVSSYADVKKILTPEQIAKLKEIWKKNK